MNADAVRTYVVAQRIGNDNAFATRIDSGQPDNASDCSGFGQFRVVDVLALTFQHEYASYLPNRSNVVVRGVKK